MPETMSPREKVAAFLKERDEACGVIEADDVEREESARLIIAALASSGDHAELIEEIALNLRSVSCDLENESSELRRYSDSLLKDAVRLEALIAENAALRIERDSYKSSESRHAMSAQLSRQCEAEAERKLAEAVGLLEPFVDAVECIDDDVRDSDHIWEQAAAMCISAGQLRAIRTFLSSKEAERG